MDIVLSIAVILFVLVNIYRGYRVGFVKIVLSMFAMLASIVLAAILVIPVGGMVKAVTSIDEQIKTKVEKVIEENDIKALPDIDKMELPDNIKAMIKENSKDSVEKLTENAADVVSNSIFNAGVFVILFVICYIVVKIVINVLNLVTKLPIINGVNALAGTAVGAIYAMGMIWVICLVLPMFANMEWAKAAISAINSNPFLTFIYENNLLVVLINNISNVKVK